MDEWTQIGPSLCIQNLCLYNGLDLTTDGDNVHFSSCQFGGPVAIALPTSTPNAWTINIYMQNAVQIASISASAVFFICWSKCQKLVIVNANGRAHVYSPQGQRLNTFSMGDETLAVGLSAVKSFAFANETGLAVINNAKHIFAVNSVNSCVLWRVQNQQNLQSTISCWAVLSNGVGPTRVLLCHRNRFLLGTQESSTQSSTFPWAFRNGPYHQMEANSATTQLILLHDTSVAQIIDAQDLQVELQRVQLDGAGPGQLFWCGNSAVGIQTAPNALTIYALITVDKERKMTEKMENLAEGAADSQKTIATASSYTFHFPEEHKSSIRVAAESDSLRVFLGSANHLLLPVSECTNSVLGLTSNEPGALLYGAELKLELKSHKAYEYIRSISAEKMPIAVNQCLEAAANHFDPSVQKRLLKAASMGIRRCVRPYDSDRFVRTCRVLRVLNALRPMGLPLSHAQLEELSLPSFVDRLVSLNHWPMALQLCHFLELPPKQGVYKVLAHWCAAMMDKHKEREMLSQGHQSVEELAQRMVARMAAYPAIGYADIAEMAARKDLPTLATILLDLETNVARQVAVMLKLQQLDRALQKAAQSQQPDLLHLVLRHMRANSSSREIELLLRKVPQALSIYQSEIRDEAPEHLLALYEQNDDFVRQAIWHLSKAEQDQDFFDSTKMTEQLSKAEKSLRQMRDSANAQLVAENAHLITDNTRREEKHSTPMAHMSVRETFLWAAANDEPALKEQLRKQHRLIEKQVFCWTLEGFARGGKWQQFEQYARTKKSPMGYLPVIQICAQHGNRNLAFRFIDRVTNFEEQIRAYLILGEVKKAATLAAEKGDLQVLQNIRRRFPPASASWNEVSKIMESVAKPM